MLRNVLTSDFLLPTFQAPRRRGILRSEIACHERAAINRDQEAIPFNGYFGRLNYRKNIIPLFEFHSLDRTGRDTTSRSQPQFGRHLLKKRLLLAFRSSP